MKISDLSDGQNLLVLKYSLEYCKTIIQEHKKTIKECGFCWYGKTGRQTTSNTISAILDEKKPAILLCTKNEAYLCDFEGLTTDTPNNGCPSYYKESQVAPTCYYKLKSIDSVSIDVLSDLIVRSSRRTLADVFSGKCMASMFFVAYKNVNELKQYNKKTFLNKQASKKPNNTAITTCRFQKSGICCNKKSVNFKYACERPLMCIERKE